MATTNSARPPWAVASGLPTAHLIRAALHAAGLIDAYGSPVPAAQSAYILYPSDALYPPGDLRLGEQLLLDCGLLLEKDGYLYRTARLTEIVALEDDEATAITFESAVLVAVANPVAFGAGNDGPQHVRELAAELITDPDRREALLLALGRKYDDALHSALGLGGEEFVVTRARDELTGLGRQDLAAGVRRLSEFADDLGYDVIAPRFGGARRLEVKTSRYTSEGLFHFYISRNEWDTGLRDPDWALVGCRINSDDGIELLGWCRAVALEPYVPMDSEGGRWVSAELEVPDTLLQSDLPPAL